MEKSTVLELSTAHITEKDNEVLREMCEEFRECSENQICSFVPLNIGAMKYGYSIVLTTEEEYFCYLQSETEESGYKLSGEFWAMMQYAFNNKYRVILLDRDAEVIEGLPVNDW